MDRQEYINQVTTRLRTLLAAEPQLPCGFVISGGWTTQTDAPITIYLEPVAPYEGVFEGMAVFSHLQQRLNEEFSDSRWYFGINLGVPHQFLGQQHLDEVDRARREQQEDNQKYRQVRLKGEP